MKLKAILLILVTGLLLCAEDGFAFFGSKITVSGSVKYNKQASGSNAFIIVLDKQGAYLGLSMIDARGGYSLKVKKSDAYILNVHPFSKDLKSGFVYYDYAITTKYIERKGRERLQVDFKPKPADTIVIMAYGANGKLIRKEAIEKRKTFAPYVYAENRTEGAPSFAVSSYVHDSKGVDKGSPDRLGIPVVVLPLGESIVLNATYWEVPGFGNIWLKADNGGQGFTATVGGGVTVLNLNYELARSGYDRLKKRYSAIKGAYAVAPSLLARIEAAGVYLEKSSLSDDMKRKAEMADLSLGESLWALEGLELVKAKKDIDASRKGDVVVKVTDASGKPLKGVTIGYGQTAHDFLFGVWGSESMDLDGFRLMKEAGANHVLFLYPWKYVEPSANRFTFEVADDYYKVDELADMGFAMKGCCLLYFEFAPDFVYGLTFDELKQNTYRRVKSAVVRDKEKVSMWTAVDEPTITNPAGLTHDQMAELTEVSIRAIKEADPGAIVHIEDNEIPLLSDIILLDESGKIKPSYQEPFYAFIKRLEAKKITGFDVLGLQFYPGGYSSSTGISFPGMDLFNLSSYLDRYAVFNKPIHLEQFSVPSGSSKKGGASRWHKRWNEDVQAEYLTSLYTIAFSKPAVESISWLSIDDVGAFIDKGGLLDKRGRPKKAYYALKTLIESWTTKGEGVTDGNGEVRFRGFGGDYLLTAVNGRRSVSKVFHVKERKRNRVGVTLP